MSANSPPEVIKDRYRLQRHLGSGGMAMVYLAHDEMLGRNVAIKFLPPHKLQSQQASDRFLREARAVARLSHTNIITLFDLGVQDGWHYQVMEYIKGYDLHKWLHERGGVVDVQEALPVIRSVLYGLAHAHANDLVHRDIKPDNILMTVEGAVKVADFGLVFSAGEARLTNADSIVGTALYLAPETISGDVFDHRADLYAVGAVFYELLTGQPPYQGGTPLQILTQVVTTPLTPPRLVNPGIPEEIDDLITRLLEKDPNERFESAEAVLRALPDEQTMQQWREAAVRHATSERLSKTRLERIVRSSTTQTRPTNRPLQSATPRTSANDDEIDERDDALINITQDGYPAAPVQDLLVYAAQEDTIEALEAERRHMARLLEEMVIDQLNLLMSQASAYEQMMTTQQGLMAISVISTLLRQVIQQARDLESRLHPTTLDTLGLEPALETLANQEMRGRRLDVVLSIQRMRERLPAQIELTLFRTAQEAIDRAARVGKADQVHVRLRQQDEALIFSIEDNGTPPTEDTLRRTRQRLESLGATVTLRHSQYGGAALTVRFSSETDIDLTEREMDVVQLVAEGLSNKEIATLLHISPRTVKFHLDNIYSKLSVNTRTEAAIYALRRGWVSQTTDPSDRG